MGSTGTLLTDGEAVVVASELLVGSSRSERHEGEVRRRHPGELLTNAFLFGFSLAVSGS